MAVLSADFQTGTNGNNVATSDAGSATILDLVSSNSLTTAGKANVKYDNAHSVVGSLACLIATGSAPGVNPYVGWSTAFGTKTDHYGRLYLYLTANPSGNLVVARPFNGASSCGQVRINSSGVVVVADSAGTVRATGTSAIALNQWIRIDFHFVHSTTAGSIVAKLYNTASSTTATETITSTGSFSTLAQATSIEFGNASGLASTTYWQASLIANATGFPGPIIANTAAPTVSGSAAVGSTLSYSSDTWNITPTSYTYQWTRDGSNIGGATSSTYVTVSADVGHAVGLKLTAVGVASNETATISSSNTISVTSGITAAFAGTSSLAATLVPYQRFVGALAGSSSLAGAVVPYRRITLGLAGASSLAPTVSAYQRITPALAGTASLAPTVTTYQTVVAALAGTSTLAGTLLALKILTGDTTDGGGLGSAAFGWAYPGQAVVEPSVTVPISLAGRGSLAPTLTPYQRFTAALSGSGSITAAVTAAVTPHPFTAALAGSSSLAAAPVALRRYVATISGSSTFAAAVVAYERATVGLAGSSSLAAQLVPLHRFAAALAGSSTLAAPLSASRAIAPALSGSSTLSLALIDYRRFVASLSGSSTLTATTSPRRGVVVSLSGTSALSATPILLRVVGAGLAGSSTLGADFRALPPGLFEGVVTAIDLPASTVSATNRVAATLVVVERAATVSTLDRLHESTLDVAERRPLVTATDRPI